MKIIQYRPDNKQEWDNHVHNSKNGTFLFCRDFIEYHGSRFSDHSLMFYHDEKLLGILPGHIQQDTYHTHSGLTYGGLVLLPSARMTQVIEMFDTLADYLKRSGTKRIIYKAVPHIYHKYPAEEDLYVLFRLGATLISRSISSTLLTDRRIPYNRLRKRGVKKAVKNHLHMVKSEDFESFWKILSENLHTKHNTHPAHSLEEIIYLKKKFPENITLFQAFDSDDIPIAGCLVFETDTVVHIQYIAASDEGRNKGAIDMLVDYVITNYPNKKYFDYGISTENEGHYLNENLISQKEGFGARGTVYDIYSVDL